MAQVQEKIERLSARLDVSTQGKAHYIMNHGYGATELIKEGIDLLYKQMINSKQPSIPALLKSLEKIKGEGKANLSSNYKKYYKDKLIEKYTR